MKTFTGKTPLFVKVVTKKEKKNDYNTLTQQSEIDNVNNKNIIPEKQKKDNNGSVSAYENHRHVVIGPSNVGETYYMLKKLERIGNKRSIQIITRSPN